MTLLISYFDPNINDGLQVVTEMSEDLFGLESWREIWGSKEIHQRGGHYLSKLKNEDLFVYPDVLTTFRKELESSCSQSNEIANKLNIDSEELKFRHT